VDLLAQGPDLIANVLPLLSVSFGKMKRAGTTGSARGMALYEEEVSTVWEGKSQPGLHLLLVALHLPLPFLLGPFLTLSPTTASSHSRMPICSSAWLTELPHWFYKSHSLVLPLWGHGAGSSSCVSDRDWSKPWCLLPVSWVSPRECPTRRWAGSRRPEIRTRAGDRVGAPLDQSQGSVHV
jgi:hypothetical protein